MWCSCRWRECLGRTNSNESSTGSEFGECFFINWHIERGVRGFGDTTFMGDQMRFLVRKLFILDWTVNILLEELKIWILRCYYFSVCPFLLRLRFFIVAFYWYLFPTQIFDLWYTAHLQLVFSFTLPHKLLSRQNINATLPPISIKTGNPRILPSGGPSSFPKYWRFQCYAPWSTCLLRCRSFLPSNDVWTT